MNKIYKVVWSKVRNCYVVASELAKRRTKGSGARGLRRAAVSLGIVAALLGGFSGSAWADGSGTIAANATGVITAGDNITISAYTSGSGYDDPTTTITISATDTTYTAGNGLQLTGTEFSVKNADSTISVDASGIKVNVGSVAENNTGLVTGGAVYTALSAKADKDGSNVTTPATWANKLGTGTVGGNNDALLVTGATVSTAVTNGSLALSGATLNATSTGASAISAASGNFKVDGSSGKVTSVGLDAGTGDIETTGAVKGGTATITGLATVGSLKVGSVDVSSALSTVGVIASGDTGAGLVKGSTVYSYLNGAKLALGAESTQIEIGKDSSASGADSIAIGSGDSTQSESGAVASAANAIAIGNSAKATKDNAIAVGYNAQAIEQSETTALGAAAYADKIYATAVGSGAEAKHFYSTALGAISQATGQYSIAVGANAQASGLNSVAIGGGLQTGNSSDLAAMANGPYSIAIGNSTSISATGDKNTAIGYNNTISDITGESPESLVKSTNLNVFGQNNKITGSSDSIFIGNHIYTNNGTESGAPVSNANHDIFIGSNINVFPNTQYAISIGENTQVLSNGQYAIAIGSGDSSGNNGATASSQYAIAVGYNAQARTENAIAIGANAFTGDTSLTATNTIAIGNTAKATGNRSTAIGYKAEAAADSATALGTNTVADKNNATAVGSSAKAKHFYSIALGAISQATGQYSTAVGANAQASGLNSVAIGGGLQTGNSSDLAAMANGPYSIAIGNSTSISATGDKNTAIGYNNIIANSADETPVVSTNLNVFGQNNKITGSRDSIFIGNSIYSEDISDRTVTGAKNTILLGNSINVGPNIEYGIGIGEKAQVLSKNAIAIGSGDETYNGARAYGGVSIAIGRAANAENNHSTAIGSEADAKGSYSIAIGDNSITRSGNSMAIGTNADANGANSIAIGSADSTNNKTSTSGDYAIAIGYHSKVENNYATAIGYSAAANGADSLALGRNAIAGGAFGKNNAIAVGLGANALALNAIALGNTASAALSNSVALGSGSVASSGTNVTSATVGGIELNGFKGNIGSDSDNTGFVVSVGQGIEQSIPTRQIQNVATGAVTATSTDAINGSQLYAVADQLQWKIGTKKASDTVGTSSGDLNNAHLTIGKLSSTVDRSNVTLVAGKDISLTSTASNTNGYEITIASTVVPAEVAAGTNTTIGTSTGDSQPTIYTVNANDYRVTAGTYSNDEHKLALTVKDSLTDTATTVNVTGIAGLDDALKFGGDIGIASTVKLNKQVNITGGATTEANLTNNNIGVVSSQDGDNGSLQIKLNKDINLGSTGSLTIGGTAISDKSATIGDVSINGTAKTITAGGIAIDGANNTLKVGGDTGITLSNATSGSTVTNTLKVGGVTISDNGTAKTITGLSNTAWDAANITSGQAATEDQLKSAMTSISGSLTDTGLKFTANSGGSLTSKLGSTIGVLGSAAQDGHTYSASNITTEIVQNAGDSTITVKMDDNPTFASVTATGQVQGGFLTDGTATLQGGALSGVTDFAASGTVTLGSGTNTVTISGGAVTATGNISGKDITASGMLSSATLKVGDVDVTTPLTTVGKVESGNAGFVTGGTVYSEVRPAADGNYVKTANTTAVNLTALDSAIGSVAADGNYIKASATSNVAQNLTALDTQVKTNADNIAALQSSTTASVGTIDADGNYIKKSDTNNVSQNLIALDTQMKTNADNIAANKAAIGTTADGSYVKAAETVGRNLNALDTQVKTNTDDIATLKNSISVQEDASGTKTTTIDGNLVIKEDDGTTKDVTAALTTEGEVAKQGEAGSEGYLKGETVYDYLNKGENGKEVKLAKESKQIAVGQGSVASGVESIAIGNETGGQRNEATGLQSIAIGFGNQVTGAHSGAFGDPTYIAADNSYAMGNSNNITATGARSFAIGNNNTVSGSDTFVLGSNVNTNASNAVVLGNNSVGEDGAVSVGSVGGERQIKHVAPGTDVNDAVTVGQVAALAQNTTTVINRVDSKLNKVGAGAAALAALHPLDTDDKFTMGMGYGNYRNSHAAAIGMFYRPTDKVMISMSGTMGNGENMFNAGISFALDKGKGFSTSKAAMARKIAAQEEKISEQDAKIQSLAAENAKLAERLAAIEAKLSK